MIPQKAFTLADLAFSNDYVPTSGHAVKKCKVPDEQGRKKLAFYKPLDATYPPMLAKLCVAIGVISRLSMGDRAADTRLIYDNKGKLVGTLSFALDDLITMQSINEQNRLKRKPPCDKTRMQPISCSIILQKF